MNFPKQIAKHIREVHFGGNWTAVAFNNALDGIHYQQATVKLPGLNTIAALVYHCNYYVSAVINILKGNPMYAHDKYSFDLPPIENEKDWEALKRKMLNDAEELASLVEQLPAEKLSDSFALEKYGSYYHNLHGVVEHTHYHLGQIVLIKKMLTHAPAVVGNEAIG